MAEDLLRVLTRFHREVVLPDLERVVEGRLAPLREEMLANFDAVFKRLDRLESEYTALSAAVARIEKRLEGVDQKIDKLALRAELLELKERVHALEQKIADIEAQL
jgi:phage shock protein A